MDTIDQVSIEHLSSALNVNTPSDIERKSNEALINKFKTLPKFAPLLLEISVNSNKLFSPEVQLNASIQLKNFICSNWKFGKDKTYNSSLVFDDEQIIIINDDDKNYIRNFLLEALVYTIETENGKVLKQLNQVIKKIIKFDFESIWKETYMNKVISCFKSGNEKNFYAGIILLHQLSKFYQFEDEEKMKIYNAELSKVVDDLVKCLYSCNDINNPFQAQFIYKILKIFFKSFQGTITEVFLQDQIFEKWSDFIVKIIQSPLKDNLIKDTKSIFWKLKRLCFQIITRIIQKYTTFPSKTQNSFKSLLLSKYLMSYFITFKTIYINVDQSANYIDDDCKKLIYYFMAYMVNRKYNAEDVIGIFINDDKMKEQMIKDAILPKEDFQSWFQEPKTYISNALQETQLYMKLRYSVNNLIDNIMNYRDKDTKSKKNPPKYFNAFLSFLISVIQKASVEEDKENQSVVNTNANYSMNKIQYNLIKESTMYLISQNSDLIEKYAPQQIEELIEKYIIPELDSPVGIMREKACIFIQKYKSHQFKNDKLPCLITTKICGILDKDKALPVRICGAIAATSMLKQPNTKELLKGNIKTLLSIYVNLMEETELEEIVESLQDIIDEFKDETSDYITQLSNYLLKFFNNIIQRDASEDKALDEAQITSSLITTFTTIIHHFVNNQQIYPQIEDHIKQLINYCIIDNVYDKLDEGIDLIEEVVKNCEKIPIKMWEFFVKIITTVIGTEEDLEEFKQKAPNQTYEGTGFEEIKGISSIICYYISKDPSNFIIGADEKGKQYITYVLNLIENVIALCKVKNSYTEISSIVNIISVLMGTFRGKVDNIHSKICEFIYQNINSKKAEFQMSLISLLSLCFIYNPELCVKNFESINQTGAILKFWSEGLDKITGKKNLKFNLMGLCCLISINPSLQSKLVLENLQGILNKIVTLAEVIEKNKEKEEKDNEYEENEDSEEKEKKDLRFENLLNNDIGEDDDEDIDLDEDEEDGDIPEFTEIERQNEIIFVENSLKHISQNFPEYYQNIINLLGDKVAKLKEIFQKEEKGV